jgi:hypothetical protein
MMFARVVLGLTGLMFAAYGLACLFVPSLPAGYSGMALPNASAVTEVVAMYGGLQAAMGVLFLYCTVRTEHLRAGLVAMVALVGGLALSRAFGLVVHGASEYNLGAVVYETTTTVLGVVALRMTAGKEVST